MIETTPAGITWDDALWESLLDADDGAQHASQEAPHAERFSWANRHKRKQAKVPDSGDGDETEVFDWNKRHERKRAVPAVTPAHAPVQLPPGTRDRYAEAAFRSEVARLAAQTEPGRNDQLNRSGFALYGFVAAGRLDEHVVYDTLRATALGTGLPPGEVHKTLLSARDGLQHPRHDHVPGNDDGAVYDPSDLVVPRTSIGSAAAGAGQSVEVAVGLGDHFWESRLVLRHARAFARARMVSPLALLGVLILRVLAVTPPYVVLPALIGGRGSLNLFVASVGPSGAGKGAVNAAAADAVDFATPTPIYTATVGSGEGIAHQYAHREKGEVVRDQDAVLFHVPEVDTLTALNNRQGSTLLSQLRSAFSGETLGFAYVDPARRIPVEAHTYRLGMVVGVQPEKAADLIGDADGGTPQRFLWLPATDPGVSAEPPPEPEPLLIPQRTWSRGPGGFHTLTVPATAARAVREAHAAPGGVTLTPESASLRGCRGARLVACSPTGPGETGIQLTVILVIAALCTNPQPSLITTRMATRSEEKYALVSTRRSASLRRPTTMRATAARVTRSTATPCSCGSRSPRHSRCSTGGWR